MARGGGDRRGGGTARPNPSRIRSAAVDQGDGGGRQRRRGEVGASGKMGSRSGARGGDHCRSVLDLAQRHRVRRIWRWVATFVVDLVAEMGSFCAGVRIAGSALFLVDPVAGTWIGVGGGSLKVEGGSDPVGGATGIGDLQQRCSWRHSKARAAMMVREDEQ